MVDYPIIIVVGCRIQPSFPGICRFLPSSSEMDGSDRESKSRLKSFNAVYIKLKTVSKLILSSDCSTLAADSEACVCLC